MTLGSLFVINFDDKLFTALPYLGVLPALVGNNGKVVTGVSAIVAELRNQVRPVEVHYIAPAKKPPPQIIITGL